MKLMVKNMKLKSKKSHLYFNRNRLSNKMNQLQKLSNFILKYLNS